MGWTFHNFSFKAKHADGTTLTKATVPLARQHPAAPAFSDLAWDAASVDHGGTLGMTAKAPGLDGTKVRFIVEHHDGDDWTFYATIPGVVKNGIATATLVAHHPSAPATGEPEDVLDEAELRFTLEPGPAADQPKAKHKPLQVTVDPPAKKPEEMPLSQVHRKIEHPSIKNPGKDDGLAGTIDSTNCDQLLKRGDILIKFAGEKSSVTEKVIIGGQKCVKALSGLFHSTLKKGDATSFHAVIYLGKGQTAEAHGGDLKTACVGLRSIDDHGGFLFQVYRCKDQALAEEASKVAEAWANRRMKYLVPVLVPFERASFGFFGHREALNYGRYARAEGGPPDVKKMFCSEFVVAAYQAAAVEDQLERSSRLKASDVKLPIGIDVQASNTSPLALDARLVLGVEKGTWEHIVEVLVRPQHAGTASEIPHGPDVTKTLADMGQPTKASWPDAAEFNYARNPWSLRSYDGKLFVASGNANNGGPASNCGPIDLWAFDKAKGWGIEYLVQDEGIDVMQVVDGQLYIPGLDSRIGPKGTSRAYKALHVMEDWARGNLHHRLAGGKWEQLRTIPNGIHIYDVLSHQGQLFTATSTLAGGTVAHSTDKGLSWKEMLTHSVPGQRTRTLWVQDGKLYASTSGGLLFVWDGAGAMTRVYCDLFPGLTENQTLFAARPVVFAKHAVYIAARELIDHDWSSEGLFCSTAPDEAKLLALPNGALARDQRIIDGILYVLATEQPTPETVLTRLFSTKDLETWTEEVRFTKPTFARSFEKHDGEWWFGLGCDPEHLHADSGRLLKAPTT